MFYVDGKKRPLGEKTEHEHAGDECVETSPVVFETRAGGGLLVETPTTAFMMQKKHAQRANK